jgi:putative membrane protein insertion efficiency factor
MPISMTEAPRKIEVDGNSYELAVDDNWGPFFERVLSAATAEDRKVDAMDIPSKPRRIRMAILALRWYRRRLSPKLGHRCVFEPSCSRYSELAFRERGIFCGAALTLWRLIRCRPGRGGIDPLL